MNDEAVAGDAGPAATGPGGVYGTGELPPLVAPGPELGPEEIARFARHLPLPQIGLTGQRRLRNARVLVIGAGGLGSPVLQYLAAAGVGTLSVIDHDVVEDSNLQRQVIHSVQSLGRPKVESARARLAATAPGTRVNSLARRIAADNAEELFSAHDLVVDGADNFATRYICNDAAELTGTPLVWGTLFQFTGQVSTFWPGRGPMLRDLFPEIPDADSVPSCALGGVFGALCGQVGSLMATEALKLICGVGRPLIGRMAMIDALEARMTELAFDPDPGRPAVTRIERAEDVCAPEDAGSRVPASLEVEEGFLSAAGCPDHPTCAPGAGNAEGPRATTPDPGDRAPSVVLIDVREDWEREVLARPGATPLRLGEIQDRGWSAITPLLAEQTTDVVFMCKTGVRSMTAARLLASQPAGPQRPCAPGADPQPAAQQDDGAREAAAASPVHPAVHSLAGGILAWAERTGNPIRY